VQERRLQRPCGHPEHDPPEMIVYEPGEYEHTCPKCGRVFRFVIRQKGTWNYGTSG
jgi:hypothetical protein